MGVFSAAHCVGVIQTVSEFLSEETDHCVAVYSVNVGGRKFRFLFWCHLGDFFHSSFYPSNHPMQFMKTVGVP